MEPKTCATCRCWRYLRTADGVRQGGCHFSAPEPPGNGQTLAVVRWPVTEETGGCEQGWRPVILNVVEAVTTPEGNEGEASYSLDLDPCVCGHGLRRHHHGEDKAMAYCLVGGCDCEQWRPKR